MILNNFSVGLQTATDYGPYVQNLASPLHTTAVVESCTELLVDQWHFMRANVRKTPDISISQCDLRFFLCDST